MQYLKHRRWIALSLAVALGASASWRLSTAQQPEILNAVPKQNTGVLMRAKLGSSQKVVEGLMAGDHAMIRKGANDLIEICDSQNWRRLEDQVVTHYRAELGRDAAKLVQQADAKNLEGAAYVYMHALTTCINCHEYSRNVLRIAQDVPRTDGVVPIPVTEQEAHRYTRNTIVR